LEMEWALNYLVESVWQVNLKTITFDNWTENVCHEKIREEYNYSFDTYFCDPYSSWQKWAVENANKLLRQYFPRNMEDEDINQYNLDIALKKINSRPRKTLWFISSEKKFTKELFCSV
jgi:IS30 family transposase